MEINTGREKETIDHVRITTEKNPDGDILAVTYQDTLGKTVRQKKNGLSVDYAYNAEGQVVASSQLGTDPNNANPIVTAYLHDKGENVTGQILHLGYDVATGNFTVTAHKLALKTYQVYPFSVYHPEAILANPSAWGKAWFNFWGI